MRHLRTTRLLAIAALAVPFLLSTLVISTQSAWAGRGSTSVNCRGVIGTDGGMWTLQGCSHEAITGSQGTVPLPPGQGYPDSPATITWTHGSNPNIPVLTTTVQFRVTIAVKRNLTSRCGPGSTDYRLMGTVTGNSASPGVRGRVNVNVCDTGGSVSNKGRVRF